MKKKSLAILLSLCMTFSFAACGSESDVRGSVESVSQETVVESSVVESSEATVESTEEVVESTEEVVESSEEVVESSEEVVNSEEQVSLGTNNGGTYTNSFLKLGCTYDDWTFMTDEQILEQNKMSAEIFGDDVQQMLEQAQTITDMMATNPNQMDSVNVTMEKLPLAYITISEKEYLEASLSGLQAAMEAGGFTIESMDMDTMQFAGAEHNALRMHTTIQNIDLYQTLVVMKKSGYIAITTATSMMEDHTDEYLAAFYALD